MLMGYRTTQDIHCYIECAEGHKIHNNEVTSYIASVRRLSSMALNPLAPVFFVIALLAISRNAFSVKCNLTWGLCILLNRLFHSTPILSGYEELELQGKRKGLHYSCRITSCTVYQEHFWALSGPAKEMKTPINTGKEIITQSTWLACEMLQPRMQTKIFITQVWMCDNVEMRICFLAPERAHMF